jgi:hypothetical protein
LKKWSPNRLSFERESTQRAFNSPTTRPALRLPSSDAADSPTGTAEAAILVMEIDDVLVAKIVSGLVSATSSLNMRCLTSRFSETALDVTFSELETRKSVLPAHLNDHIDVSQRPHPHSRINDRYAFPCMSRVCFLDLSLRDILGQ